MKITCPECSAVFDVPVPLMGAGRRVRCGACGHVWMQGPLQETGNFGSFRPMDEGAGIDPIPASVHPGDDMDHDHDDGPGFFADVNIGQLGRMLGGFVAGWAIAAAIILGLSSIHMLPGSLMPLAVAMGAKAPVSIEGLEIEDVSVKAGEKTTSVSGRVLNTSDLTRNIPEIEITPQAADGMDVSAVIVKADPITLKGGESAVFSVEMQGVYTPQNRMILRFIP